MRDREDPISEAKATGASPGAPHPPDDVASLYSWANLHGVKYRDFSASRQEARAQNRYRLLVESRPSDAEEATRTPVESALAQPPRPEQPRPEQPRPQQQTKAAGWQETTRPVPPAVPPGIDEDHAAVSALVPVRTLSQLVPAAPLAASPEESGTVVSPRAWTDLGTAHQRTPQDSLRRDSPRQATEEAASHWFALQRLLGGRPEGAATIGGEESALPAPELRAPVVAFFSVAGGAGKTSLTANVARALSARGEQVLAVETSAFGILPFYFGARDLRPGTVRTFASNVGNVPIHVLSLDTEQQGKDRPAHWLQRELYRASRDVSRILIDVSSGFHGVIDEVLRLNAAIVIPVVADVSTVASLQAVDACFRARQPQNDRVLPYFLLNQFDPVQPLHQEVRQLLAQQFGDRLLPLAVRRSPLVSEAVAQGLTVIDYAPTTQLSEDIHHLAGWLRGLAQAGATSFRGVRWSER